MHFKLETALEYASPEMSSKTGVYQDVTQCVLVKIYRHCLDAVRISETSVYFYQTTRRYIAEGCVPLSNVRFYYFSVTEA
jgi:hypothetical protein